MPSLAEFQALLRDAVVDGDGRRLTPILIGGADPEKRLAIHSRHYLASLSRALMEKFPAVNWLIGSPLLSEAARAYIRRHPPRAPCIAEYGESFPAFLASLPATESMPWIRNVGELEWHVGHAVLAVDRPPLAAAAMSSLDPERLAEVALELQPGLRYLASPWPVDNLLKMFVDQSAPDRYELLPQDVYLEVYGLRGAFDISRLDPGTFAFRKALAAGESIGAAAVLALEADAEFEPGGALTALMSAGFVVAAHAPGKRNAR
jgi:hypothetical protein